MLLSDIGYFNWYNPCLLNLYRLNARKKGDKVINICTGAHNEYVVHIYSLEVDPFAMIFLLFNDMTETECLLLLTIWMLGVSSLISSCCQNTASSTSRMYCN